MSESLWKSEVVEEAQLEEPAAEPVAEHIAEAAEESSALSLSVDEFSALEERILRTVNLVKQERQARAAAEERANAAEAQIGKHTPLVDRLKATRVARQDFHAGGRGLPAPADGQVRNGGADSIDR